MSDGENFSRMLANAILDGARDAGLSIDDYIAREESIRAMKETRAREARDRAELSTYCAAIPELSDVELEALARSGQLDAEEKWHFDHREEMESP